MVVLTACGEDSEPFTGTVLDNPYSVPDTALVSTEGDSYSLAADTDRRLTLLFFGYTRCPDECPAVLSHLASALTRLDDDDRDQVDVVVVTSDPTYDTESILRDYLDRFDTSFIGLVGDFDTIQAVGLEVGVGIDETDPGGHNTQIIAIDSADEAPVFWSKDTTSAQFANDIHTLLKDS